MKLRNIKFGSGRNRERDLLRQIMDLFDLSLLNKNTNSSNNIMRDVSFTENTQFWYKILHNQLYPEQVIYLEGFRILEWLPFSPGLFFTDDSINTRNDVLRTGIFRDASENILHRMKNINLYKNESESFVELIPEAKGRMILSGVGSVRLTSKFIKNQETYFMCATSSGVSHEGIPIAISSDLYSKIINIVKEGHSNKSFGLSGRLKLFPTEFSFFKYSRKIPKYYLEVDNIYGYYENSSKVSNNLVSVAISYSDRESNYNSRWSFCQFSPDKYDEQLGFAVEWLNDYAMRHSHTSDDIIILGDFDEQKEHFENIEFSIMKIFKNEYSPEFLENYFKKHHLNLTLNMGDTFSNITNSIIVNRSLVSSSFNKIDDLLGNENAQIIKKVAEIVELSGSKEGGELLDIFNEELLKPQPKKSLLKSIWKGICDLVPVLLQTAEIAEKMKPIIGL